ncbi:MAG: hypothetical protein HOP23_03085 [Methylococcaceae bacterium]|nr:hypothetical protein [Methylococcaceae bacterium]
MKNYNNRWLCLIPVLCWTSPTLADYQTDIGYTALADWLGTSTPAGVGVSVTQVEASQVPTADSAFPVFAPDSTQFALDKNFSFPGLTSTSPSSHASGVGALFYGSNAIAAGITQISSYEVNNWLNSIATNTVQAPVNGSRIANHSWVGAGATSADDSAILRYVDRQVERNETIQVVGMANSSSFSPLLGNAYNVIAVGRTDGGHDAGADAIDSVYVAGRTRPDLVAPETTTSAATPIVSAAAALLVETGHAGGLGLSKGSTTVNGVGTLYNAERSETIKAALMAGADRVTANGFLAPANITDYRSSGHQTSNGLDDRFGAGQINILHSYQIIAAGEQNSLQDGGSNAGAIANYGFDYDAAFGGSAGANRTATYAFNATADMTLTAALVWNLGVANNSGLATTLHNLNLELFDVTTQTTTALSASTLDNTENLWVSLITGHDYELQVKAGETGNFSWDYALAWQMNTLQAAPVPLPGAVYLFASAIAGLAVAARRRKL